MERDVYIYIYISFIFLHVKPGNNQTIFCKMMMFGSDYSVTEFNLVHLQLNPLYFLTLL